MTDLILNARFLNRAPTGVDRVAVELFTALAAAGLPDRFEDWRALRPAGAVLSTPAASTVIKRTETMRPFTGHAWEQITLGRAHPDDWLMSLCNIGPVWRHRQIAMLHDAQVFREPDSYARAFRMWYHAMQPRLGHRAGMILTVSEHSKSELEHFGVVPAGKARVVPNGGDHILRNAADASVLQRHGLTPSGYFLAIGSLAPHKNIALLAQAAGDRHDTRHPLVIAGGGAAGVFCDAGIKPSDGIRPIGRVTDAELRALYENATALVFPSLTEGFGLPPLEAMFCGCPVIATTAGAVPEVCGTAALPVDPRDRAGWTAAMTEITEDPELRTTLSQAGKKRAAAFTWAKAAATLSHHLSELP